MPWESGCVFDGDEKCAIQFLINKLKKKDSERFSHNLNHINFKRDLIHELRNFTESGKSSPHIVRVKCKNEHKQKKKKMSYERAHLINLVSFKDFIIVSVMVNCK